jgi:imidazolonepropionase-like amidohydrolase
LLTLIKNANLFDGHSADLIADVDVVIEEDRIVEVGPRLSAAADLAIDLRGRVLMPGLIDAHVHVYAVELDLTRAMRRPFSYVAHHASRFLKHMLNTGFTTVRDVGGGDVGLAHALKDGLVTGSRLIYGGRLLSQTGGHADWRPGHEHDPTCIPCGCGMIDQRMSVLADGVDEVLKATREELRRGASHIKIVASGGVASPEDPVNALQYSPEEIAAIVGETRRHGSYVAAHCHPAGAIRACAELGVRTIEHATLIDEETAKLVKQSGAYIVPTMAIIAGLAKDGAALGLPRASQLKLEEIAGQAQSAMAIAHAAGVPLGFGTDLLGPLYTRNLTEFDLRRDVFAPVEILRQATSVNARMMRMEGKIGCVAPGAFADLVAVEGNPLDDIGVMTAGPAAMPLIVQAGGVVRNSLPEAG